VLYIDSRRRNDAIWGSFVYSGVMYPSSPYSDLVSEWKALRGSCNLRVREVACVGADRTLLVAEIGGHDKQVVALASGTHGDEPAAPWALLSIVRDGLLDPRFAYRIWPCVNPSGYAAGTRCNAEGEDINRSFRSAGSTPEARAIITANRDRRFVLSLDLHEDCDSEGFYCYEPKTQPGGLLGPSVVEAVAEAGLPLQELVEYDLGYSPDVYAHLILERGCVRYDPTLDVVQLSGMPYSVRMFRQAAQRVMTFESPSKLLWEDRLAMHRTAVRVALDKI
jgi:murein peptide amidase A